MNRHELEKKSKALDVEMARQRAELARMNALLQEMKKITAESKKESDSILPPSKAPPK
jgi:hypothetical protein